MYPRGSDTTGFGFASAIVVVAALALGGPASLIAGTYHVNGACGDDGWTGLDPNCASPDGPKRTIQAGLDAAVDGDTVIVAEDTYSGQGNRDLDFGGKAIALRSTDPNDPNVVAATIIDPQFLGRAFDFDDGEGPNAVVAGLTITQGVGLSGGGIQCDGSEPTITRCTISLCTANWGGGMANSACSPTVSHCTFVTNVALIGGGGGMMNSEGSSPAVDHCEFIGNMSVLANGGGICNHTHSSPTVVQCTFLDNAAPVVNGGGVFCYDDSNPLLIDCTFVSNQAVYGGGLATITASPTLVRCVFESNTGVHGGGIDLTDDSDPLLSECRFSGNTAHWGGGIDDWNTGATISDCVFTGNSAAGGGGGMVNFGGSWLTMTRCLFSGNKSTDHAGGLACADSDATIVGCTFCGNSADLSGGAIASGNSSVDITNCTFAGNLTADGGGAVSDLENDSLTLANCTISGNRADVSGGGLYCAGRDSSLVNTALWGNTAPQGTQITLVGTSSTMLTVRYCDLESGPNAVYIDPNCTLVWGPGNIEADPNFVGGGLGTWTAPGTYDPNTFQTTLTDATADWPVGGLVGKRINPDTTSARQLAIVGNTATTITVWADRETVDDSNATPPSGAGYQIHDDHLSPGSPCLQAGDPNGSYAGQTDVDGQSRQNGTVDIGSDEYWPDVDYALDLTVHNEIWGEVSFDPEPDDPNQPAYPAGTVVSLTAEPTVGRIFTNWEIYDPNHPGDANYVSTDTNDVTVIVMMADREATAAFQCGGSVGLLLPLLLIGLTALGRARAVTGRSRPRAG